MLLQKPIAIPVVSLMGLCTVKSHGEEHGTIVAKTGDFCNDSPSGLKSIPVFSSGKPPHSRSLNGQIEPSWKSVKDSHSACGLTEFSVPLRPKKPSQGAALGFEGR